jgi:hypothetical protein
MRSIKNLGNQTLKFNGIEDVEDEKSEFSNLIKPLLEEVKKNSD